MKSEFFLDLIFIRSKGGGADDFTDAVEALLEPLFSGKAYWYVECKQEHANEHEQELEIARVEVKGQGFWDSEEQLLAYLEENAEPLFWEWLQGYRVLAERKQAGECCGCGNGEIGAQAI